MSTVGVRELARNASRLIDEVRSTGRPVIITRHGKPVAALHFIDDDALEDFVLANAPEFVTSMREAEAAARAGRTEPGEAVFAELDEE